MLRIKNIKRSPKVGQDFYKKEIQKILKLKDDEFTWEVHQESLDARRKDNIFYLGQVNVWPKIKISKKIIDRGKYIEEIEEESYSIPKLSSSIQPVVVGSGPCGLFASYVLAKAGLKPILLERGKRVEERIKDVENFWQGGVLSLDSNVQFGEGGAGTFSDGKLTSRSKDPRGRLIIDKFIEFGAPKEISYMKKPHIGTDRLRKVLIDFRKELIDLGCEIHFEEKFMGIKKENKQYKIETEKATYKSPILILALGHSARDTFEFLYEFGLEMESKSFAVGFRIEQSQEIINLRQNGEKFKDYLPPAEYALTHQAGDIGCYTFCMCPGGHVVAAASEQGHLVVNGMSFYNRDGSNANAAILATVDKNIFGEGVLAGMDFQRKIEKKAFEMAGKNYNAPVQKVEDYLSYKKTEKLGELEATYKPNVSFCDLNEMYPKKINDSIHEALRNMDKKIPGFASGDAILTGVETRSSSPVRLLRDKNSLESISHPGIYPAGEGAGYAGGIISSAIDGIRIAEKVIEKLQKKA